MKKYQYTLLGLVLMISYVKSVDLRVDPLVLLDQGLVRGDRASGGDYTTFLGIPYAAVDPDNPFGPAQPPAPFQEEVYRANNGSIMCPQVRRGGETESDVGIETLDCLRLNIYVPNDATSNNPKPVLVWVHGGGFSNGHAGLYGAQNLVKQDIIVVTVNYRLGPYGFMCLDVPNVTGNQGLKDQFEALSWVRNNIRAFGGNPFNVTLAGQSAGACSVLLQLYSQKNKLFHKIIAESGSPQISGMFVNADTEAAVKISNYLGLNTTDTTEALEYLAKLPHNLVTSATAALGLILRPCKERSFSGVENFIDNDPFHLSNPRKVSNTTILIGHTSKEENRLPSSTSGYFDSDPFSKRMAENFNLEGDRLNWVASTIKHYYIGDEAITDQVTSKMGDFESDFYFNHPIKRTVDNLLTDGAGPIYSYMFSYVVDSGEDGAGHSEELKYLFNMDDKLLTEEQQLISIHMTTLWANFVKYGNPTPRNQNPPITWAPVTADTRPYLVIDQPLRMDSRVYNERMAFWDMFHDSYGSLNKLTRNCRV